MCPSSLMILCIALPYVASTRFHILNSTTSACPGQTTGISCLTLQQYATNPSSADNVTLMLESGNHTLSSVLRQPDAYSLTITSESNAIVACSTTQAQFIIGSLQILHISDITFTGCRSSVFQLDSAVGRAVFSNVVFHDDYGYFGGAISIRLGSVESLLVIDCIFHMNGANGGGGSIGARRSNVTIVRSIFNRTSTSREGGAVSSQESFITVVNSSFTHTRGGRGGGAISVSRDSSLEVTNCNFSNAETSESGGAIYAVDTHLLHINKSNFSSCSSRYHGGALRIDGNKNRLTLIQNNFNDNRAHEYYGGAVTINSPFEVIIEQNNFINNKAIATTNGQGGALFVGNAQGLSLNQCSFINNNAWAIGGAIRAYVTTKPVYVNNSYFCNNTAGHTGGAVNLDGTSTILSTNQSSFLNNVAGSDGGAISAYTWNSLTRIYRSTFYNNSAGSSGGAIHMSAGNFPLFVNQSNFTYNTAGTKGGGVSVLGTNSSISLGDCHFTDNIATTEGGGALHSNGRFSNVSLEGTTFIRNVAAFCGAVNIEEYYHNHVEFISSTFVHNQAISVEGQVGANGGGVGCIRNASVLLKNSVFDNNKANYYAGVLKITECYTVVEECSFFNNTAGVDGGVFFTYEHPSIYYVTRSNFSENRANEDGGVMYIGRCQSEVKVEESLFTFNGVDGRGGVFVILGSTLHINMTTMYNNTAGMGSIISACNSEITALGEELPVTTDPTFSFCTSYSEGMPNEQRQTTEGGTYTSTITKFEDGASDHSRPETNTTTYNSPTMATGTLQTEADIVHLSNGTTDIESDITQQPVSPPNMVTDTTESMLQPTTQPIDRNPGTTFGDHLTTDRMNAILNSQLDVAIAPNGDHSLITYASLGLSILMLVIVLPTVAFISIFCIRVCQGKALKPLSVTVNPSTTMISLLKDKFDEIELKDSNSAK